jgi:tetratricopeptide (TPR) repeat protein
MAPTSRRLLRTPAGSAALALAAAACAASVRVAPLTDLPPTAEAISFLGDTLWSVPITVETAQRRLASLQRARALLAARPDDLNARLGVARRTAGMGRLRESLALLSEAIDLHRDDPRLYRLRGEVLLRTRRLDAAVRDLQAAARLMILDSLVTEFIEVDEVGIVGVGLRHSTFLGLGLAFYLKGDFRRSIEALERSLGVARNADEAASAAVWLVLAQRRHGREAAALAIVRAWRSDAQVMLRLAEHQLMLAWRGDLPLDSLRASMAAGQDPDEEALYTYAAGLSLLRSGLIDQARGLFELVRTLGDWTSMAYLAAEAELARLGARSPPPSRGVGGADQLDDSGRQLGDAATPLAAGHLDVGVGRQAELRRPLPPRGELSGSGQLVGLGERDHDRPAARRQEGAHRQVVPGRRVPDVEQPHHAGEPPPLADHAFDQAPKPASLRGGGPGVAVAGKIQEIEQGEAEDVQVLRLSGGPAGPSHPPAQQRVQQARFADVGAAQERDFRQSRREDVRRIGEAADELDGDAGERSWRARRSAYASRTARGRSVTTSGGLASVIDSGVMTTSRTSSRVGRSNMMSVITFSRIARSPLAPVPRLSALKATARSAS